MEVYIKLCIEFMKAGLFAIGGGLATLPFLFNMADRYPWFTRSQLIDMVAISESTPGAIGVNMSTYAGINAGGILGGLIATVSLTIPSIIIILLVANAMDSFKEHRLVKSGFYGIRPATAGLIAGAMVPVMEMSLFNDFASFSVKYPELSVFAIMLVGVFGLRKAHPIAFIVAAAFIGIVFKF